MANEVIRPVSTVADPGAHRRHVAGRTPRSPRPRWLSWLGWTLLFFTPSAVWAFASPPYSVPDEPHHAVKAVAVWFGQLEGTRVPGAPPVERTYDIPAVWATETSPAVCYAFLPDVTPDECDDRLLTGDAEIVPVRTYHGGFPPLYYALVGWGGRLTGSVEGVYLMRLSSALLAAAMLAAAVLALRRVMRGGTALAAVLVAATPMTYFLAGSINPNGLEVAAGIALWCHVLAIGRWHERSAGRPIPAALLAGLLMSGSVLALTRLLSPVLVGLIVVLALAAVGWPTVTSLLRDRRCCATFAAVAAIATISLAVVQISGNAVGLYGAPALGSQDPWRHVAGLSFDFVEQMIGWFGWLDTPPTDLLTWLWLSAIIGLVAVAAVLGRPRELVAVAATIVAVIVMPIVVQAPRLFDYGMVWQGRHGLPLAVGIPILALVVIDRHASSIVGLAARVSIAASVLVAVANVHAVWWALHRYTVGISDRGFDLAEGPWQPPLGAWTWVAAIALWAVAMTALVVMGERGRHPLCSPTTPPVRDGAGAPSEQGQSTVADAAATTATSSSVGRKVRPAVDRWA